MGIDKLKKRIELTENLIDEYNVRIRAAGTAKDRAELQELVREYKAERNGMITALRIMEEA